MTKLHALAQLGQSVWLDDIRRSLLTSGKLQEWVNLGVQGVTSNPTIFERAIAESTDYEADLARLVKQGLSVEQIYEALVVEDIQRAADVLRPVYEATQARDGYVSVEVNPALAHDTEQTVVEAKRLFESLGRPNVMIKVPATPAGILAVEELIAIGVNVNVTLIFSIETYREVAEAYLRGLTRLAENDSQTPGGRSLSQVASVASLFVSRIDTAVDAELERVGYRSLRGKIAIANAKLAYLQFQQTFMGSRWEELVAQGARVQRLLWASTGTKNPDYPDTLYVDALIGPETVTTLPPATLEKFLDHGTVALTLTKDIETAQRRIARLMELGIDLREITLKLQADGVAAFAKSFQSLLESIDQKRQRLLRETEENSSQKFH